MRSPAGLGSCEAGPEARRGHRRRGACRGSPLVVELGEVGGEGCILEPPSVELGVEAAERPGVRSVGVRRKRGRGEAAGRRRRALERGRGGTGYWQPRFAETRAAADSTAAEREFVEEFRRLFAEAVDLRLQGDQAPRVYLSGGLDSTAVATPGRALCPAAP